MNKRILLLCDKPKNQASTIVEHIESIQNYSKHKIDIINPVFTDKCLNVRVLKPYALIIIHYSIVIVLDHYLSPHNRYMIANFTGPKILFIQDEYRWVDQTISCIKALSIDTIFTCIPYNEIEKVYSKEKLPNVKYINTLTGYVNEKLLENNLPDYDDRMVDVGYRGRKISACYGRLAQEKYEIVPKFLEATKNYNLVSDLSYHEQDRIYGDPWLNFIKNSKSMLGTESGASIFDFTGDIRKNVEKYEKENPNASFQELEELFFKGLDGLINVNQISPRIFEAACLKSLMILFEGEYSRILEPYRHYVPLKKDFSNMQEVVNILKDKNKWQQITQFAYEEIAKNPKYSYRTFVQLLDETIDSYKINTKKIFFLKSVLFVNSVFCKLRKIKTPTRRVLRLLNRICNTKIIPFLKSIRISIKILYELFITPIYKIIKYARYNSLIVFMGKLVKKIPFSYKILQFILTIRYFINNNSLLSKSRSMFMFANSFVNNLWSKGCKTLEFSKIKKTLFLIIDLNNQKFNKRFKLLILDNKLIICAKLPSCKHARGYKTIKKTVRKLLENHNQIIKCENCRWVEKGYEL